jgi:hypothetical protein
MLKGIDLAEEGVLVNVEEDGDEVFTNIPKYCYCGNYKGKGSKIIKKNGFMVCSGCGCSWKGVKVKHGK